VDFFVSRDQEHNNLELAKPKLLHFSEATNEITPSASLSWWSENLPLSTESKKQEAQARSKQQQAAGSAHVWLDTS
jgi:hypothetical protein